MYDYEEMRQKHGSCIPQVIDTPILVFDYFTLGEVFACLASILIFGAIFYSLSLMVISIIIILGFAPIIRRRNKKGFWLHYPYKNFSMNLPGIVNPGKNQKYSD